MKKTRPALTIACFCLLCAAGSGKAASPGMVRHIVWQPAPQVATETSGENPAAPDDIAAASAALAAGEPLPEVLEALGSPEARYLLRRRQALPETEEGNERKTEPEPEFRLVRETDDTGKVRWRFLLGKGKEMVVEPDERAWAFWDNPEGYDQDFSELHLVRTGYTAVWVTSRHYRRIPAPTPLPRSPSGGTFYRATTWCAASPSPAPAIFCACIPSTGYSIPLPILAQPFTLPACSFVTYAPSSDAAHHVPEPAPIVLAALALASLLTHRRRKDKHVPPPRPCGGGGGGWR